MPFSSTSRPADEREPAPVGPRVRRHRRPRHEVGQHRGVLGREPELDQSRPQRLADRHEPVGAGEQPRLLAAQPSRVDRRLGQRATTAQLEARVRVRRPTAKAGPPVPVSDPDRAEQAEVVQVQDGARARAAGRRERPPPEQRVDVVHVHDVGAQTAHGPRDLVGMDAAGEHRPGRAARSERRRSSARAPRLDRRGCGAALRSPARPAPPRPRSGSGCGAGARASVGARLCQRAGAA